MTWMRQRKILRKLKKIFRIRQSKYSRIIRKKLIRSKRASTKPRMIFKKSHMKLEIKSKSQGKILSTTSIN